MSGSDPKPKSSLTSVLLLTSAAQDFLNAEENLKLADQALEGAESELYKREQRLHDHAGMRAVHVFTQGLFAGDRGKNWRIFRDTVSHHRRRRDACAQAQALLWKDLLEKLGTSSPDAAELVSQYRTIANAGEGIRSLSTYAETFFYGLMYFDPDSGLRFGDIRDDHGNLRRMVDSMKAVLLHPGMNEAIRNEVSQLPTEWLEDLYPQAHQLSGMSIHQSGFSACLGRLLVLINTEESFLHELILARVQKLVE